MTESICHNVKPAANQLKRRNNQIMETKPLTTIDEIVKSFERNWGRPEFRTFKDEIEPFLRSQLLSLIGEVEGKIVDLGKTMTNEHKDILDQALSLIRGMKS